MALSLNKVIAAGNLAADPETRFLPNGDAVTNLRIGVTEKYKKDGQTAEKTEWMSIVLYRRLAELAQQYLKKGSNVYFEGRLRTRKWTDKEGKDHYKTEIEADEMKFISTKSSGSSGASGSTGGGVGNGAPAPEPASKPNDDEGDDIPFASCGIGSDPVMRKAERRFRGV